MACRNLRCSREKTRSSAGIRDLRKNLQSIIHCQQKCLVELALNALQNFDAYVCTVIISKKLGKMVARETQVSQVPVPFPTALRATSTSA